MGSDLELFPKLCLEPTPQISERVPFLLSSGNQPEERESRSQKWRKVSEHVVGLSRLCFGQSGGGLWPTEIDFEIDPTGGPNVGKTVAKRPFRS